MRLIDADAIEYTHAIARSLDDDHNWNELCVTKDEIEDMPTIQPQRIKGHWIKISPANIYECSECGKSVMTNDICAYDFCHGCGAEMREVTECLTGLKEQ